MVSTEHPRRLAWFIPLRLATFLVVFFVVVFWMKFPGFLALPFFLYAGVTLGFTLLLALDKQQRLRSVNAAMVVLHFLLEITIESGIIYATGNLNSPFSGLFILTIVSAALVYRLVGTLVVASAVALAYAFIVWLGLTNNDPEWSLRALQTVFDTQETAFYSIFLHLLIFYLVAFIAGYLAQRLRDQDLRLADTSRALRRARLETDDILHHLNSGLITVDAEGGIVYFNRTAERILGYHEDEIKGLPCDEAFAERMPGLACSLMDGVRRRAAYLRHELEITDPNGRRVPLGLSISILTEEDQSTPRGVIAIFSDLTDAKELEAKVRTADRLAAVGELSASIAHEIRNPLAAISGSVEVLKAALPVEGENLRLMDLIVKESDRLTKILSEFLLYARIDRPSYTKVDLCRLTNDVIHILAHHASHHEGIQLVFDADQSVIYVAGDDDLLKQVLLNLGVNACQAIGNSAGEVHFRVFSRDPEKVVLQVSDTGCGMPPDVLRRMYEPFFSTKKQGTGLGLAIVDRVCTALKLGLTVDSAPGQGATITLEFRVCCAPSHNSLPTTNTVAPASSC